MTRFMESLPAFRSIARDFEDREASLLARGPLDADDADAYDPPYGELALSEAEWDAYANAPEGDSESDY